LLHEIIGIYGRPFHKKPFFSPVSKIARTSGPRIVPELLHIWLMHAHADLKNPLNPNLAYKPPPSTLPQPNLTTSDLIKLYNDWDTACHQLK